MRAGDPVNARALRRPVLLSLLAMMWLGLAGEVLPSPVGGACQFLGFVAAVAMFGFGVRAASAFSRHASIAAHPVAYSRWMSSILPMRPPSDDRFDRRVWFGIAGGFAGALLLAVWRTFA